jgi:hypothetical protein
MNKVSYKWCESCVHWMNPELCTAQNLSILALPPRKIRTFFNRWRAKPFENSNPRGKASAEDQRASSPWSRCRVTARMTAQHVQDKRAVGPSAGRAGQRSSRVRVLSPPGGPPPLPASPLVGHPPGARARRRRAAVPDRDRRLPTRPAQVDELRSVWSRTRPLPCSAPV